MIASALPDRIRRVFRADSMNAEFAILRRLRMLLLAVAAVCAAGAAQAQAQTQDLRTQAQEDQLHPSVPQTSVGKLLPKAVREVGGLRPWLYDFGITFALNYQQDLLGATTGGVRRGTTYMGRLEGVVEWDLEKAFGWKGALFHVGAYQIHGMGLSRHFLQTIQPVSDLEGLATTRLNEIWLEQKLGDQVSVRIGQLAADAEFFLTPFHALPVGGAYGWPAIMAANLPNGGPAYPFATPGVRLRYDASQDILLRAAVYNGDPVGPNCIGDPQKCNRNGINFRMRDPAFAIAEGEVGYALPYLGGLQGHTRVGAWANFGRFPDRRYDVFGVPLAAPVSVGLPLQHRGDRGVYATFDQQIWRPSEKPDDAGTGVFVYGRIASAPSDRNQVNFYFDGGVSFIGLVPGRPNDQFGFMGAYARIAPSVRGNDVDVNLYSAAFGPIHDFEALLQATYQIQVTPGWSLQPNIQYVIHPNGHVVDPTDPLGQRAVRNALVLGVRSSLKF